MYPRCRKVRIHTPPCPGVLSGVRMEKPPTGRMNFNTSQEPNNYSVHIVIRRPARARNLRTQTFCSVCLMGKTFAHVKASVEIPLTYSYLERRAFPNLIPEDFYCRVTPASLSQFTNATKLYRQIGLENHDRNNAGTVRGPTTEDLMCPVQWRGAWKECRRNVVHRTVPQ